MSAFTEWFQSRFHRECDRVDAYKALLTEEQTEPSIAAVARAAGLSDRAAGRHLRALGLL